jgi:hypothetical protein
MYLTTHGRSKEKAIKHNLDQASGWLRAWRDGQVLTGQNDWHRFAIAYHESIHVIVLSIIQAPKAGISFHHEETERMRVRCCMTLPQAVLELLLSVGGTTLDLIGTLKDVTNLPDRELIPEPDALSLVWRYVELCKQAAGFFKNWPGVHTEERWNEATRPLAGSRSSPYRFGGTSILNPRDPAVARPIEIPRPEATFDREAVVGMSDLRSALPDISLHEFFRLVVAFRDAIDKVTRIDPKGNVMPGFWGAVGLKHYDFGICALHRADHPYCLDAWRSFNASWESKVASGEFKPGPTIVHDSMYGFSVVRDYVPALSHTEMFLSSFSIPASSS